MLRNLIAAGPYKIHTILTDNGIQFTNRMQDTSAFDHIFSRVCRENEIEQRLTKGNHPWTNGQVERMNRTIKEATVKRDHYDTHSQLEAHITDFIAAYNYARRLKTLHGLTPFEYICKIWTSEPERFNSNPTHHTLGLGFVDVQDS
ncbi:Integrase core domain-containing protein [Aliiroseovarius crassostreae]|nr:Integrase core domain-containing protein [Aliiroseovarius crassostreae]